MLHIIDYSTPVAVSNLVLTSEPTPSGPFCGGPVVFTCRGTEITIILKWYLNNTVISYYTFDPDHEFPRNVLLTSPVPLAVEIINVEITGSSININSTLSVSDVSSLSGSSLHCQDGVGFQSNTIAIVVNSIGNLELAI